MNPVCVLNAEKNWLKNINWTGEFVLPFPKAKFNYSNANFLSPKSAVVQPAVHESLSFF